MSREPEGFLFPNGNAIFFDENASQCAEYQKYGWSGVHKYRKEYPDADIHMAVWQSRSINRTIELQDGAIDKIER